MFDNFQGCSKCVVFILPESMHVCLESEATSEKRAAKRRSELERLRANMNGQPDSAIGLKEKKIHSHYLEKIAHFETF